MAYDGCEASEVRAPPELTQPGMDELFNQSSRENVLVSIFNADAASAIKEAE